MGIVELLIPGQFVEVVLNTARVSVTDVLRNDSIANRSMVQMYLLTVDTETL